MKFFAVGIGDLPILVRSAVSGMDVTCAALLGLMWALPPGLIESFRLPAAGLFAAILVATLQATFYLLLAIVQFQHRAGRYLSLMATYALSSILFSAMFLFWEFGWQAPVLARALGLSAGALFAVLALRKVLFAVHPAGPVHLRSKEMFFLGFRYLPASIAPTLIPFAARLVVAQAVSVSAVALFGVASLFGSAILLVGNAFRLSVQPKLFYAVHSRDSAGFRQLGLSILLFLLGLPFLGFFVWLAYSFVVSPLLGTDYQGAEALVAELCIAAMAQVLFEICQAVYQAFSRVSLITMGSVVVILLALFLQFSLVESAGASGVARAISISYACVSVPYIVIGLVAIRNFRRTTAGLS